MKIKKIWVKKYKQLENFTVDFTKFENLVALIGNNSSGKSSILELISIIFSGLYGNPVDDYFDLEFKVNNKSKEEISELSDLPYNVIACYSGEHKKLDSIYSQYLNEYQIKDRRKEEFQLPKMLYIDSKFAEVFLFLNYYQNTEESYSLKFDLSKEYLEMKNLRDTKYSRFFKFLNSTNIFYGGEIFSNDFFDSFKEYLRKEENIKRLDSRTEKRKLEDLIINCYLLGYLTGISLIDVNNRNMKDILSEGELKKILIEGVHNYLAEKNSIVLLDEPDAHIHISNKDSLLHVMETTCECQTIFTTHSPTIAFKLSKGFISLEKHDEKLKAVHKDKNYISELTNNTMSLSKSLVFLNSDSSIKLLVEGHTDVNYIEKALEHFKVDNRYKNIDLEIVPIGGTGETKKFYEKFVKETITDSLVVFLHDKDDAGKNARKALYHISKQKDESMKVEKEKLCKDIENGKKANHDPKDFINQDIEKSFIKVNDNIYSLYVAKENNSKVEDLFTNEKIDELLECFVKEKIGEKKGQKTFCKVDNLSLNKYIKDTISKKYIEFKKEDFKGFKSLFDNIEKINNQYKIVSDKNENR